MLSYRTLPSVALATALLLAASTPAAARRPHARSASAIHAAELHGGGAWGPLGAAHARRAVVEIWQVDALHLGNGHLLGRLKANGSPVWS